MTIRQITLLLIIGGLALFSCSVQENQDNAIKSSDDIDSTVVQEPSIEDSGKSELKFIVPPRIAFAIFAIIDNEECTINEYVAELNKQLPRDYSEDDKNIILERIIKVGNTLYLKIKVPNSITDQLSDAVELEVMRLIFKDYITHGADKHDEFKRDLTLFHDNGLDICFQIKSPTDTKLLTIKIAELIPDQQ